MQNTSYSLYAIFQSDVVCSDKLIFNAIQGLTVAKIINVNSLDDIEKYAYSTYYPSNTPQDCLIKFYVTSTGECFYMNRIFFARSEGENAPIKIMALIKYNESIGETIGILDANYISLFPMIYRIYNQIRNLKIVLGIGTLSTPHQAYVNPNPVFPDSTIKLPLIL